MADTQSNSTISSSGVITSGTSTVVPTPAPINIAAHHNLPITLTTTNFTSWRTHLSALLDGLDLHGYITGQTPRPDATVDPAGSTLWFRQDRLLLAAILGSVSADILPLLSTAKTSSEAWDTLNRAFASTSRAHVMHLKTSLTKASLGSRSVTDYVNSVKAIADELGLIDTPISTDDLTLYLINGLGPAYRDIVSSVRTRDTPFRFEELRDRLIEHEQYLKQADIDTAQLVATAHVAQSSAFPSRSNNPGRSPSSSRGGYHPQRGSRGSRGRGGGRHNGNRSHSYHNHQNSGTQYGPQHHSSSVICQLCGYQGHTAITCRRLQPSAHIAQSPTYASNPQPWVMDTGASHNITPDLGNLSIHSEYDGTDEIQIADGNGSIHGGGGGPRPVQ